MRLVLGSNSPRRLDLLKQIGINPSRVVSPDCDETALKGESPRELALRLSALKAKAVEIHDDEILITADTVVGLGIRSLPKAMNNEEVRDCITLLSGRAHRVYTGVTLRTLHKTISRVVETRLTVKRLSQEEINAYIKGGEGVGKAGGYAIQGHFACFITKLAGSQSNVIGLPLFEVAQMLGGFGYSPAKNWGNA